MKASKIIIENRLGVSDTEALQRALTVISNGLISKTSRGLQYCFLTSFSDGSLVSVTKNPSGSHRFVLHR